MSVPEETPTSCASAIRLDPDATWRDAGGATGQRHCFRIDHVAPGLVALDLSTPGLATARARLEALGGVAAVAETATSLLLAVAEAGTLHVAVTSEDPRQPLPGYKLRTRFIEKSAFAKNEDDGEADPDPDPLVLCEADGPEVSLLSRAKVADRCGGGEVDDHGDTFRCATDLRLRGPVTGEIDNAWGDDEDLFRLRISEMRTVELSSNGPTDVAGELYDRLGHRLGADDDGGDDDNFRLVRTLAPGVYFLRVAGAHGATGPYSLTMRSLAGTSR